MLPPARQHLDARVRSFQNVPANENEKHFAAIIHAVMPSPSHNRRRLFDILLRTNWASFWFVAGICYVVCLAPFADQSRHRSLLSHRHLFVSILIFASHGRCYRPRTRAVCTRIY